MTMWLCASLSAHPLGAADIAACSEVQLRATEWYDAAGCGAPSRAELRAECTAWAVTGSFHRLGVEVAGCLDRGVADDHQTTGTRIVKDVATCAFHMARQLRPDRQPHMQEDVALRLFHMAAALEGAAAPGLAGVVNLLDDVRSGGQPCRQTEALTRAAAALYRRHGFLVDKASRWKPYLLGNRMVEVTPEAAAKVGCPPGQSSEEELLSEKRGDYLTPASARDCSCLRPGVWQMGAGIADADIEIFVRLVKAMSRSRRTPLRVFAVGNSWGYSSVILGLLLGRYGWGSVDVIDAESEDRCTATGSRLTRRLANASRLDVVVTAGFSPQDVPAAMRHPTYDLAFIDGLHTNEALAADWAAIVPRLKHDAPVAVVLHDVGITALHEAVESLPPAWSRAVPLGGAYKNLLGTTIMHRGFPAGTFDGW
eukprot:TRINITY_DN45434_c0_g1_i1.p1 TRINITY_DN45434_c0_g1~~TRINITY_DN45434_c0_g1_i1.p1  ORF type:complete len:425 (+),score=86.56 TRINITY_DN45434_c0_g1_i1:86-1360(+)